jgi:FkbM family methyltransferase
MDQLVHRMITEVTVSHIPLWIARYTPRRVKAAIHHVRFLDKGLMTIYGALISGESVVIEDGPLKGIKLSTSRHTSHAHIQGTYEREAQEAVDAMVRPGDICYDLGASIGYMTLLMARKAKHVYAFEPAPHAIAEMKRHLAANAMENVTIVPSPVSNCVREVRFVLTDTAYGSSINDTETRWPVLQLQTTTLDSFVANHPAPDFLKLDVEGEEGAVLEGAQELLGQRKTRICCEVHHREAAESVLATLERFGYTTTLLDGTPATVPQNVIPGEFHIISRP